MTTNSITVELYRVLVRGISGRGNVAPGVPVSGLELVCIAVVLRAIKGVQPRTYKHKNSS